MPKVWGWRFESRDTDVVLASVASLGTGDVHLLAPTTQPNNNTLVAAPAATSVFAATTTRRLHHHDEMTATCTSVAATVGATNATITIQYPCAC